MLDNDNTSKEEGNNSAITTNTRRNFLKKATIGAPIVIATSTKPAWGAACMSGMMSGNLSNHQQQACELSGGLSHRHWKNHWVGKRKQHFRNNNRSKPLRNKFSGCLNHFYVKNGQNYSFSTYERNSKLNGASFQSLLENGDQFEREIVTAFINASMNAASPGFYPYTVTEVHEIYDAAYSGKANASDVAVMLEGIHQS